MISVKRHCAPLISSFGDVTVITVALVLQQQGEKLNPVTVYVTSLKNWMWSEILYDTEFHYQGTGKMIIMKLFKAKNF